MMIIDAHVHLWDHLSGDIHGKPIINRNNGVVDFGGELKQMMPPYMLDGKNSVEMLIANMNYAGVSTAIVTQEYLDGLQNDYLQTAYKKYPNRIFPMGLVEFRQEHFFNDVKTLISQGFKGIKIPAEKLITPQKRYSLTSKEFMKTFQLMEQENIILGVDLYEGATQVSEMQEIIQQFPELNITLGHFAMVNRPDWHTQLALAKNTNVYIESGGITWLFHREFYPYHGAIKALKEASEIVGENKLMWGSDYPRTMTEITYKMAFDFILKSEELSTDFKKKFLGETAQKFYELPTCYTPIKVSSILD